MSVLSLHGPTSYNARVSMALEELLTAIKADPKQVQVVSTLRPLNNFSFQLVLRFELYLQ